MNGSSLALKEIVQRFDKAASNYDDAAVMQAEVAQHLVDWATPPVSPVDILDIGAGTGFVSKAVEKRWPGATVTALDSAPNMLHRAQQKMPHLNIIIGDAARIDITTRYDAIFCSMVLHWLPDPVDALQRWQSWLKPGGKLYAALLVEGSFHEWRMLCRSSGLKDGLWNMPPLQFAQDMASRTERHVFPVTYLSAKDFLRRLKTTGASQPRAGHEVLKIAAMRSLLHRAPKPFSVSYETLYVEIPASGN